MHTDEAYVVSGVLFTLASIIPSVLHLLVLW